MAEAGKRRGSTGHYRRNVHGKVENLVGRISDGGVVYGPWLEGTGSRNQTTRFKGYASFRKTAQYIQKEKLGPALEKAAARIVQEMG